MRCQRGAARITRVDLISSRFSEAVGTSCREHKSSLSMNGVPNYVILCGERLDKSQKMADCLAFGETCRVYVAVCELKSTSPRASKIEEQLRNGVDRAMKICNDVASDFRPQIFPILVASEYPSTSTLASLRKIRIKIYGDKKKIILEKRTCRFLDVIKRYQ